MARRPLRVAAARRPRRPRAGGRREAGACGAAGRSRPRAPSSPQPPRRACVQTRSPTLPAAAREAPGPAFHSARAGSAPASRGALGEREGEGRAARVAAGLPEAPRTPHPAPRRGAPAGPGRRRRRPPGFFGRASGPGPARRGRRRAPTSARPTEHERSRRVRGQPGPASAQAARSLRGVGGRCSREPRTGHSQPPRTQEPPPPLPAAAALDAAGKPVTASSAAGCFRSLPSAARGAGSLSGRGFEGAWSPASSAHWAPRTRPRPALPRLRARKPDRPSVCVRARGGVSFRGLVRWGAGPVRGGLG